VVSHAGGRPGPAPHGQTGDPGVVHDPVEQDPPTDHPPNVPI